MYALRIASRVPRVSAQRFAPVASFHTTSLRLAGKESALHNENRANEAEHHKQDQLQKQKEGKGHWKDELASDSESIVKADRGDIDGSKETIEQLQKETVKLSQKADEKAKSNV